MTKKESTVFRKFAVNFPPLRSQPFMLFAVPCFGPIRLKQMWTPLSPFWLVRKIVFSKKNRFGQVSIGSLKPLIAMKLLPKLSCFRSLDFLEGKDYHPSSMPYCDLGFG